MGRTEGCTEQLSSLIVFVDGGVGHDIEDQFFLATFLPPPDGGVLPAVLPVDLGVVLILIVLLTDGGCPSVPPGR